MSDPRLIVSVVVVAVLVLAGVLARGGIQRMDLSPEQRRRTRNVVRYAMVLVAVIGLAVVWADQLASAAIVASGFAVAIVLFNKDLILSILGWWMKTVSGAYRIGDRIRVGDCRGDVIDYGILSTTLMAVEADAQHGMRTGNVITLPNSLFLTEPVVNETRILGFEWCEIAFELAVDQDWQSAQLMLLREAEAIVSEYRDTLEQQLGEMSQHFAFHPIQMTPHVFVKATGNKGLSMWVRLPLPARQIAVLADRLNRRFIAWSTEV